MNVLAIGAVFVGFGAALVPPPPAANLTCSSTLDTSAVCIGDPFVCNLEAPCKAKNLSVVVNGRTVDDAYWMYDEETMQVRTNYYALVSSAVTVEIASNDENCSFTAVYVAGVSGQCRSHPILLQDVTPTPGAMAALQGGETFYFVYFVSALNSIYNVSLATFAHPAIQVVKFSVSVPYSGKNGTLNSVTTLAADSEEFGKADLRVSLQNITSGAVAKVNVTCYVHRYVRAGAQLHLDLFAAYTYSNVTLIRTVRNSIYMVALPSTQNVSLKLPFHSLVDYTSQQRLVPTNNGDVFSAEISVKVPCVSTDLNISIVVPNYYVWRNMQPCVTLNITNVRVKRLPYDVSHVQSLCDYPSCPATIASSVPTNISYAYHPLNTVLKAVIGPIQYREIPGDSSDLGNCTDADIQIVLTGRVVVDSACRYNVCDILHEDNVTVLVDFVRESTSANWADWTSPSMFEVHSHTNFSIFVGGPELGLFTYSSTYQVDAGDSLVLTFGVAPPQWYSVYYANVSFGFDSRFVTSNKAEFCFYNGTVGQLFCHEVLVQNRRIRLYFEK